MRRALVPGTFDPITEGHTDIIRRAAQVFDEVIVAVAASEGKNNTRRLFALEERVELARATVAGIPGVRVEPFTGLLVDFARQMDAPVLVKGLRAITDFEYEFQMTAINYEMDADIETLFIMSPPKYMYLSSSIVRELAQFGGPFRDFVSQPVYEALCGKFDLDPSTGRPRGGADV